MSTDQRNKLLENNQRRLTAGNELKLADFNLDLYNEVVAFLQNIDLQIYNNAVPIYCLE